ncbi:MAG: YgiT-type zinc finger protein [Nanoarchaeota archaeon]
MSICYECEKGKLEKKDVDYKKYGVLIGKYPAEVCTNCHEIFFESNVVAQIENKLKEKQLWGIAAKSKIGTSGHALDVKLNKKLVEFLHIQKGQEVLIEPVSKNKFEVSVM